MGSIIVNEPSNSYLVTRMPVIQKEDREVQQKYTQNSLSQGVYHNHGNRGHSHTLPKEGFNHRHGNGTLGEEILSKMEEKKPQSQPKEKTLSNEGKNHFHEEAEHSHTFPMGQGVRHSHRGGALGSYAKENATVALPKENNKTVVVSKENNGQELESLIKKSKTDLSESDYIKIMQEIADIYEHRLDIKNNYQLSAIYHDKVWEKYKNKKSYFKLGVLLYEKKANSGILSGSSILNKLVELEYQPAIEYMNFKDTGKTKINIATLNLEYEKTDKTNRNSIDEFLKNYGYHKNEKVDEIYKALFSLKNKANFQRTEKQFEADLMSYSRDYSDFIKVSVLDERANNQTTIDTLPNTPINVNLRKNDVLIKLKLTPKEDSPYGIKHNHNIKIKATLIVTKSISGIVGMFYEPDYDAYDIFFTMPLEEGENNPKNIKYGVTSGVGFPLFEGTLGLKSNVEYSFKYKILGIEK